MSKFTCGNEKEGLCNTRDYGLNQYKNPCYSCCYKCQHAIDMDCSIVCPKVAEYYYPEDRGEDDK